MAVMCFGVSRTMLIYLLACTACGTRHNTIDDESGGGDSGTGSGFIPNDIADEIKQLSAHDRVKILNLAGKAFAWITGTETQAEYLAGGKLFNWFGYESFAASSAEKVSRGALGRACLETLDAGQRQVLYTLLETHIPVLNTLMDERSDIITRIDLLRQAGTSLASDVLTPISESAGRREASMGSGVAAAFGEILRALGPEQREQLVALRDGTTGVPDSAEVDEELKALDQAEVGEVKNLASKLLTWATGSREDNEFLDAGRVANYFGFGYFRDEPLPDDEAAATAKTVLRENSGRAFLEALEPSGRQIIYDLWDAMRSDYASYEDNHAEIAILLMVHQDSENEDSERAIALGEENGRLEGVMTIGQAEAFAAVLHALSPEQLGYLHGLRDGSIAWQGGD